MGTECTTMGDIRTNGISNQEYEMIKMIEMGVLENDGSSPTVAGKR
jgi:hypothetical protein